MRPLRQTATEGASVRTPGAPRSRTHSAAEVRMRKPSSVQTSSERVGLNERRDTYPHSEMQLVRGNDRACGGAVG
eukprot:scaffold66139_cov69-Phaeocystis_antarctica.AAC.1